LPGGTASAEALRQLFESWIGLAVNEVRLSGCH